MQKETHSFLELPKCAPWMLAAVLALLVLPPCPLSWGQAVSATLLGNVTDNTGAAVPNAEVQILESATGIAHAGATNESGNYTFPDLTPGTYSVSVESKGFKKETRASVDVVVNTTTRVDLTLQPGSVNESVIVTAAPAIMQTDRADVSANIESHTLQSVPVAVNQNFQTLLTLVPGVGPPVFQHSPPVLSRRRSTASRARATAIRSRALMTMSGRGFSKC
jgi:Carboxypeptidase regulatory-like domain